MKGYVKKLSFIVIFALIFCIGCKPKSKTASDEQPSPAPVQTSSIEPSESAAVSQTEPAQLVSPTDVAVTVNGRDITEGEIDELVKPQLDRMLENARRRNMPGNFLDEAKKQLHDQGVEAAILKELIEADIVKNNIVVTDDEINKHVEELADQQNMSLEDLKTIIESSGQDFDQWKKQMQFDKRIAVNKLIELQGFGSTEVSEEQALAYYNDNNEVFETPEQVRASHILIRLDVPDDTTDLEKAENNARKEAEQLLQQIKDGADFAELAKSHSDCPSSKQGGDLGFAKREDWVEQFSDAAFALEPNEISDVVKTRFGFHVIKVTDRQEAGTKSFDEVKKDITGMLKMQKQQGLIAKYFDMLKSKATIVYPEGKEPAKQTQPEN